MQLPLPDHDPVLARVAQYWASLDKDGPVPEWDIVPAGRALGKLVARLSLVHVEAPMRLTMRVAGSAGRDFFDMTMTGTDLLDITPHPDRLRRYNRFKSVVDVPCGFQTRATLPGEGATPKTFETLVLPVRPRGRDTIMALMATISPEMPRNAPIRDIKLVQDFAYLDLGAGLPDDDVVPGLRQA